jgi:uncharacterized protein YxeA
MSTKKSIISMISVIFSIVIISVFAMPVSAYDDNNMAVNSENISYVQTLDKTVDEDGIVNENAVKQNKDTISAKAEYGYYDDDYDYEYESSGSGFNIIIGIIVGIISAFIAFFGVTQRYKFKETAAASNYVGRNNVNFVNKEDRFLRTRTTKTRINNNPPPHDGGHHR